MPGVRLNGEDHGAPFSISISRCVRDLQEGDYRIGGSSYDTNKTTDYLI